MFRVHRCQATTTAMKASTMEQPAIDEQVQRQIGRRDSRTTKKACDVVVAVARHWRHPCSFSQRYDSNMNDKHSEARIVRIFILAAARASVSVYDT